MGSRALSQPGQANAQGRSPKGQGARREGTRRTGRGQRAAAGQTVSTRPRPPTPARPWTHMRTEEEPRGRPLPPRQWPLGHSKAGPVMVTQGLGGPARCPTHLSTRPPGGWAGLQKASPQGLPGTTEAPTPQAGGRLCPTCQLGPGLPPCRTTRTPTGTGARGHRHRTGRQPLLQRPWGLAPSRPREPPRRAPQGPTPLGHCWTHTGGKAGNGPSRGATPPRPSARSPTLRAPTRT